MSSFVIRDARAGDAAPLGDVFRRASLSNESDRAPLLAHPDALVWSGPPDPPARCRAAVPPEGGPPIGFATTVRRGAALELDDLFVDPDRMRQGVARRLIDDAVRHARRQGVARIEVDGNPHALAFYLAVGFVVTGAIRTEFGAGHRLGLEV
jgi:GNAT superfamily N-acetyltransferase